MTPALEDRIRALDPLACPRVLADFLDDMRETADAGVMSKGVDLAELEPEAVDALAEEFPAVGAALSDDSTTDIWQRAEAVRALLLAFATEAPSADRERLERAVASVETTSVDTAGLPPLLIAVGVVMLLQMKLDVSYERVNGKGHLKIAVSKKPTSETLIGKVLAPIFGH
jgi:hypothetical protein